MDIEYDKKYSLDKDFEILSRDGKYLFIDFNNANWFRTDDTGKEIIELCDGTMKMDEVIERIAGRFKFDMNFLKANFGDFIKKAIESGLLLETGKEKQKIETTFQKDPDEIWIHVTGRCNLECPFCYSRSGSNVSMELDPEDILSFVECVPEKSRNRIIISGGEPFLYKGLPQLVKMLSGMGFHVGVLTNGTAGEEMYEHVIPNIEMIQISLDGTSAYYNDYTRGKGSFEKTFRKMKIINDLGFKNTAVSFTPNKFNIVDLPNIPGFAFDNNISHIHVTRYMPTGRGKDSIADYLPNSSQYKENFDKFISRYHEINARINIIRESNQFNLDEKDKRQFIGVTYANDQLQKVLTKNKKKTCGLGLSLISINYDGNIYPCANLVHEEYKLGNIKNDSFTDIVQRANGTYYELSVDNSSTVCYKCKFKYFCGGGCRACALSSGDILGEDPLCDYYKNAMLENMWELSM